MIYVTGDTHRNFKRVEKFCQQFETNRDDILIILGDAGINYLGGEADFDFKTWISKLPITLFCIHGNHEMRPETIDTYHETEWRGGTVFIEDDFPNLIFAKDGEVYDFGLDAKAIVIGGAYSVDKYYRLAVGANWFPDEQPSEETKRRVERKLDELGWEIDLVFSHTAPLKYEPVESFLLGLDQSTVDKTTEEWLDKIEDKLDYKQWLCGHYHTQKRVDDFEIMFQNFGMLAEFQEVSK